MNPYDDHLIHLIEQTTPEPEALYDVEARFEKRFSKERRKKRIKISSAVTSILVVFMFAAANTNTAWAQNLKKIPVLKELFSYMTFSKDYEDQIEELGLVSDNGEHQLYLQYAVSDDKQILLYLQFPDYITLEGHDQLLVDIIRIYDLNTGENYTDSFISPSRAAAELFDHNYLNLFGILSPGLDEHYPEELGIEVSATINRRTFSSSSGMVIDDTDELGIFTFETHLQKMTKRKTMEINRNISIEGNELIIKAIESSPLESSILLDHDPTDSDRITDLKGILKDPATGQILSEHLGSMIYDFEGSIYAIMLDRDALGKDARSVELVITEAALLNKEKEQITIDFDRKSMTSEMDGAKLSMISVGKTTSLSIQFAYEEPGVMYNPFQFMYETEDGELKPLPYPSHSGEDDFYTISFVFDAEMHGTITLRQQGHTPGNYVKLKEPVSIIIDVPEVFEPIPSITP